MTGPSTSNDNLLIIFIKAPRAGYVKTRIAKTIGAENAAAVYRALVLDLLENLSPAQNFDIQLMVWPPDGRDEIQDWLSVKYPIRVQAEGDLGEKMRNAFMNGFHQGYKKIIIIGSDLPVLTSQHISTAFQELQRVDLIVGPSTDGGYYLIGLNKPFPGLFKKISWSTSQVLHQTLNRAEKSSMTVQLLKEMRDVDDFQDLKFLLNNQQNTILLPTLSRTIAVLEKIINRNP
jgi:rSAM/selenodomain-associated transferase 1